MHLVEQAPNRRNDRQRPLRVCQAAISRGVWLALLFSSIVESAPGAVFPAGKPEWSVEFGPGTIGPPAHFGPVDQTRGVLVTLYSGQIVFLGPQGDRRSTLTVDLPIETPAVAADLLGDGHLAVVAVDSWGSVYCFDETGRRRWKHQRTVQSGEFRVPVFADLEGKGKLDVIVADSRGHLQALDAQGRLRLEIAATHYRVSVPTVGDVNGDGKPEITFGTDAGEVYCVSPHGDLLWATVLDGCFGRALPLVADPGGQGRYDVYFPTAFNNAHPGLFALDAATGQERWKAPSLLQSYRSTVVCDLNGDGRNEILFGDKNTSLFCLDADGRQRWRTQLDGRGIFFAPAIADLQGNGAATLFVSVRSGGSTGKSLYAVDAAGRVLDAAEVPGGGECPPMLCRFCGQPDVSLITLSGAGRLQCCRPEQKPGAARILWAGVRNDPLNAGYVKSTQVPVSKPRWPVTASAPWVQRRSAVGGLNRIQLTPPTTDAQTVCVRTVCPDGVIRVELLHVEPPATNLVASFPAAAPGEYQVTVRWLDQLSNAVVRTELFSYYLSREFKADQARLRKTVAELQAVGRQLPALRGLTDYFQAEATAALDRARRTKAVADFDAWHQRADYFVGLARYCREQSVKGQVLVRQITNPWEGFDAPEFFGDTGGPVNAVSAQMPGNAYESAAVALSNLRPVPATLRLSCGPFECGTNHVPAGRVLELREVLTVAPNGTDEPVEDALPLLGAGQTIRLEPGETRKVWLTLRSQAFSAGSWHAVLKAGDIAAPESPAQIPLDLEVYPVRLPEHFTYHECNWLYLNSISDEALREATLRDALEHYMNVLCIPGVSLQVDAQGNLGQASSAAHDELVKRLAGRAFFLVFGPVSLQWPAGTHPDTALQQKAFADSLHWYGAHMQSLGCGYEEFAIYLQDEPGLMGRDANFEAFVARVKQFKAADSRIQLYANPAGGARAELLEPLRDLIDVWAPDLHLLREQPEELGRIFKHGKQYWHYEAPGDQRQLDPLGFYRMKPWVAFQLGMTGGGYWVYSSAPFWYSEPGAGSEYGSVYPTDHGPVTTKRWEASREGIQDFELLWLLRKTAEGSPPAARQEALALLNEAVRFVTRGQEKVTDISRHVRPYTPDYHQWMDYRRRLIRMQMQLSGP
jgi:outer membrane protein assembly factor BamB